jgi:hypothetical protein
LLRRNQGFLSKDFLKGRENNLKDYPNFHVTLVRPKQKVKNAVNAANPMILSEAGTGFNPIATLISMPLFAFRPCALGQIINQAAGEMKETLKPFPGGGNQAFAQSYTALVLLVRCYAQHIYSSTRAARRAGSHPDFPWLWVESLPSASALRRFRAENRDAVHHCLTAALQNQAGEKISAGLLTKFSPPQLAKEAGRRIIMAVYQDSTVLRAE